MSVTATLGTTTPGGDVQAEQKFYRALGTLALSGNYATNGDSLSFAGKVPIPNTTPIQVWIAGLGSYEYSYVKSSGKVKIQYGTATLGGGIETYTQGDIKGSANTDRITPGGTLPTNGALLSSLAAANNTTAFTMAANPDIPRNVGIVLKNTVAGASQGNAANYVIVGTFRGSAQTETIAFAATDIAATAQNDVFVKYGSKPFDTITSVTPDAAQPASWQHAVGIGSKLGLPRNFGTATEADLKKLFKNAADLAITGTADTTNATVNFGTLTDGDDVFVEWNAANSGLPTLTKTELSAGAYPSAITSDVVSFEAIFPKL